MATGSAIVKNAFREGNLIAASAELTADQLAEGLDVLNNFIDTVYGFELGENLFDWPFPPRNNAPTQSRYPLFPRDESLAARVWPYPPPNVRILLGVDLATTLTLPPAPEDGARLQFVNVGAQDVAIQVETNGRLFGGSTNPSTTPTELHQQRYFYRADLADWVLIETATADAQVPFPPTYDELLELAVLSRLSSRFGRALTPDQVQRHMRLISKLKSQYRQKTPAGVDEYNMFLVPRSDYDRSRFYDGGELLS